MRIQSESFKPRPETIKLIEDCCNALKPETVDISEWHNSYIYHNKTRIAFDYDIIQEHVLPDSTVLEIAAVPLILTAALKRTNLKVTGIDIAPERYNSSIEQLGITMLKCDIEKDKLPIESNTYDTVVFNEIFEHLRINPIFTMREVLRVLKPNGLLLMSSPNLRSIRGLKHFLLQNRAFSCLGNIYAEYEKLEKLGHMGHVREYTSKEVIDFLENIGFEMTMLIYRGRCYSKVAQIAIRLFPTLRPFITYVAIKPE